MTDIDGIARDVDSNGSSLVRYLKGTLKFGAPPGASEVIVPTATQLSGAAWLEAMLEGQKIGIQVGKGTTAVTPTDTKLEDRINHGRCGKSGATAEFNNPSFETGDLTNWTPANTGSMAAPAVGSAAWALKDGTYYCTLISSAAGNAGDYAQISQDIDLTNITHLKFQLKGEEYYADCFRFEVLVDGHAISYKEIAETDYPNQLVDVCVYTGVHTVTFRCIADENYSNGGYPSGAWIDNIETIQADPEICLLYTSPSPRDRTRSRMPSSA